MNKLYLNSVKIKNTKLNNKIMEIKKISLMILCVISLGFTLQSCKPDDTKLQKEVAAVITSVDSKISSTVKDGIATLSGTVDSEEVKMKAEEVIKSVKGIKSVINNIEVKKVEAPIINPDQVIISTITDKLKTENLSGVNVEVVDGEVILTGDVKRADLTKIMQIANESSPKKVTNKLNIK